MKNYILVGCLAALALMGCKKYLDAKPDKALATLATLVDMQALLDDNLRLNTQTVYAAEVAADDYYLKDAAMAAISPEGDKRIYNWEKGNQFEGAGDGWYYTYSPVYYGNVVLENIINLKRDAGNAKEWDNIKGQAYFYKGIAMLFGAAVWAPAYDEATAKNTLGLPIRASSDFNVVSKRASVAETYGQLLSDLKQAAQLLPVSQVHVMRPSKIAAYAIISRAYLMMNKYQEAGLYADSALKLNNVLVDYNDLNTAAANAFTAYKGEVLAHFSIANPAILSQSNAVVVPELYQLYQPDDLRKNIFYKSVGTNLYAFKGSYSGGNALFFGPAVDEMYLNRAECYARLNKLSEALNDLNNLMRKRWNKNKVYVPYASSDKEQVINDILLERRKELLMRGLRWGDLKRLNKLGYNLTVKRSYNANQAVLLPNDSRYVMSLPEAVLENSGMQQNP
ncbi:MAG: RagB/SusD family nutrient uptake outer membrane protein [Pedobacter sp.]|nr:MAG: RagB/SusD family nutrient uptake outer membrane protein [Pedobacter sp.]